MIDSFKEWNAKGSDGVAAIVQNRKRNIDYALYFITFSLVKSVLFNLGSSVGPNRAEDAFHYAYTTAL